MRKRVWFSTYVMDRWHCALMGRPLAIADADCDVTLPDVVDSHMELFVQHVKLSGILGEILRRVYSPRARAHLSDPTKMVPIVQHLQAALGEWHRLLPSHLQIDENETNQDKLAVGGPLIVCYFAVALMLHRPFITAHDSQHGTDLEKEELYSGASSRCTRIARRMVDLGRRVPKQAYARFGFYFSGEIVD